MSNVMERYYFKTEGQELDVSCLEKCMVKNNAIMIGSVACQECIHCLKSDANYWGCTWIVCERIKEATQNKESIIKGEKGN